MIKFSVLGPLEIHVSGVAHQLRGLGRKTALISLLVADNRWVSANTLMYELWSGSRPSNPENALQANMSRLRRTLDKADPERRTSRLSSGSAGYRLVTTADEFDGRTFLAAVSALEVDVGGSRPDVLADRLRDVLSVWRGPVLGGIVGGPLCQAGAVRYERARLRAFEMLFDAELHCGNHGAILAEFGTLVTTYTPLQQRFCEQLMIALYRSGRQVDALDLYRRTVDRINKVGATLSERLIACERAILNHDPTLGAAPFGREPRQRVMAGAPWRSGHRPLSSP
jgi:DNA-binding SARP family transcriptional activator